MTRQNFLLFVVAVFVSYIFIISCSSGSGDTDGDYDGPIYNGNTVDGDQSSDGDVINPDGDTDTDFPLDGDGDTENSDVEIDPSKLGSISGTIYTSTEMAGFTMYVQAFDVNPFLDWSALPVDYVTLDGDANLTEKPFKFTGIKSAKYYIRVFVDVENNEDLDDDIFAVYPDSVLMIAEDPSLKDITGIDIYLDKRSPELGSISGTLHLGQAYQGRRVVLAVAESKPDGVEFWPRSVVFSEPAAGQVRNFSLNNLSDGTYFIVAYIESEGEGVYLVYISPYDPLVIEVLKPARKDYPNEVFYIGVADPKFGSISGAIELPKAVDGALGVYLYGSNVAGQDVKSIEPLAFIIVQNDGVSTRHDYVVGNLKNEDELWVAGLLQRDEEHLAIGFHDPGDTPLSIDLAFPSSKNLTGVDIKVPITEVTGNLSIYNDLEPESASLFFADISLEWVNTALTLTVNEYGGGTDVSFVEESEKGSTVSSDYTMFPVIGGEWTAIVAMKIPGANEGEYSTKWCYPIYPDTIIGNDNFIPDIVTFPIDGTQFDVVKNISVDTTPSSTIPISIPVIGGLQVGDWMCSTF